MLGQFSSTSTLSFWAVASQAVDWPTRTPGLVSGGRVTFRACIWALRLSRRARPSGSAAIAFSYWAICESWAVVSPSLLRTEAGVGFLAARKFGRNEVLSGTLLDWAASAHVGGCHLEAPASGAFLCVWWALATLLACY